VTTIGGIDPVQPRPNILWSDKSLQQSRRGGLPDRLHICERGKAFLRRADIAQQHDRVETRVDFLKAAANFVGRARVGG